MKHLLRFIAFILLGIAPALPAAAQSTISVGYFKEWPLPALYGKSTGAFEKAIGVPVRWQVFHDSTTMTAALASGSIDIGLSLGIVPIVLAKSAGQDIKIIDIAVDYEGNEGCIIRSGLGISKDNPKALEGGKVALPVGTIVHFGLLKQLSEMGVDAATLEFRDMSPQRALVTLEQGNTDIACGWGMVYERMQPLGIRVDTLLERPLNGHFVFDAIVTSERAASQKADALAIFLKTNAEITQQFQNDPASMLPIIASEAGLTPNAAKITLQGFRFPTLSERLSDDWLGRGVGASIAELSGFFVDQATLEQVPNGLDTLIDVNFLQNALALQQAEHEAARAAEQAANPQTDSPPTADQAVDQTVDQ